MRPIFPLLAILLLIPFSFSSEIIDSKMEKISNLFEDPATYEPGTLIVSFTPTTTLDGAKTLLEKYELVIRSGEKCTTESYGGPGQETVETQKCLNSEEWNDSLKTAIVSVPEGQEKMEALELIQEETIIWVEPNYLTYTTGDESSSNMNQTRPSILEQEESSLVENSYYWNWTMTHEPSKNGLPIMALIVIILLVAGVWWALKKK